MVKILTEFCLSLIKRFTWLDIFLVCPHCAEAGLSLNELQCRYHGYLETSNCRRCYKGVDFLNHSEKTAIKLDYANIILSFILGIAVSEYLNLQGLLQLSGWILFSIFFAFISEKLFLSNIYRQIIKLGPSVPPPEPRSP